MTPVAQRQPTRLTGWHVLALVVGFFAVVIAVDATFALMAYRTFPGQVSVTPYEDGVAYNRKIAQLEAQDRLGWKAIAAVTSGGAVRIEVRDQDGTPVSGLAAQGRLERPATESGRVALVFRPVAAGVYEATPRVGSGAWDMYATLTDPQGRRFDAERRLTWP